MGYIGYKSRFCLIGRISPFFLLLYTLHQHILFRNVHQQETVSRQHSFFPDFHNFFIVIFSFYLLYPFHIHEEFIQLSGYGLIFAHGTQFLKHLFGIGIGIQVPIQFIHYDKSIPHLLKDPFPADFHDTEKFILMYTDNNG